MTDGNDPIVQTVYRQTGKDSYRPATEKEIQEGIYLVHKEGLTKREYIAAMAMQGILSQMPNTPWGVEKQAKYYAEQYPGFTMFQAVAAESASQADALIEALNKTKDQ